MVVKPKTLIASACTALKIRLFFCAVLLIALSPGCLWATTVQTQVSGEFCVLPDLEEAISQYVQLAAEGGWPKIPAGTSLREGDRNDRILLLKKRLIASADLAAPSDQEDFFDSVLTEAVQKFQTRHGLAADGIVGAKTLAALNVPISERIRQLAASLKRCQPLPPVLESRHILVNIADFTLKLYEDGELRLSMPVIVGKTYRQTPVFSSRISSLVLNPNWEVPYSIATKDLLPKVKKDPGYLDRQGFQVFRGWKPAQKIDPATIDWTKLSARQFPYRLRQTPGPDNSLGRVKFLFPNPYDVYLHDTPAKELFQKDSRPFSSGCIRLAKPLELAAYLLQGTPLDSLENLTREIAGGKTRSVAIPAPIPIHIVYMTAWVDHEGIIQFRQDIYNRDQAM